MTLIQAPLVFFHVLADPQGHPSALLFDAGEGDPALLRPLFDDPDFAALTRATHGACRAGLPGPIAAALARLGWQAVPAGALFDAPHRFDPALVPPGTRWVTGDWYLAPPPRPTPAQAASRALALQLARRVAEDADTRDIEELLRQDAALSYHLMRLVNSVATGAPRRITSYSQAILLLGRIQLRRWLNLMLFAARPGDARCAMLLARAAMRAHAMELLAREAGLDRNLQEQGFMTGMFSLLGVLFGMPLGDLLAPLSLGEAVHGALLGRDGELGALLACVEQAEQGGFGAVAAHLAALQVTHGAFNRAMAQASDRMLDVVRLAGGA